MELESLYKTYKPLLFSVAYRILGTVSDAEDIVQDVFLDLERLAEDQITNLKAYLIKMTTNRCLNLLNSALKRREVYTGPWLPEPLLNQSEHPIEKVMKDEMVSYAFLVLLEQLSPVERAVFVLRETLAYDYKEIAGILGKTEANCRKIYSRAKQRLHNHEIKEHPDNTEHVELLANAFIHASATGSFEKLIDLLTEDVVLVSDGGGKVMAALNPIITKKRVSAFLKGISAKGSFIGELHPVIINGQRGVLQIRDGKLIKAICFEVDSARQNIQKIFIILNPDKLTHIPLPKEML